MKLRSEEMPHSFLSSEDILVSLECCCFRHMPTLTGVILGLVLLLLSPDPPSLTSIMITEF